MHVPATQRITRTPTVLPIIGKQTVNGRQWLHVRLNGKTVHSGWINGEAVQQGTTTWAVIIKLSSRKTIIYHRGRQVRSISVVIGKPSTPTPTGDFYIVKKVPQPSSSVLGPWVLYTSAWAKYETGGIGLEVALHGRRGLMADPLGSARSHGCVRMNDTQAAWLAKRLPLGSPVTIIQ